MRCAAIRRQRKFPESSSLALLRGASAEADGTNPRDVTDSCPVEIPPALNHSSTAVSRRETRETAADAFTQPFCGSGDVALIQKNYCEPVDCAGRPGADNQPDPHVWNRRRSSLHQPQHSGSSDQTNGQNFHYPPSSASPASALPPKPTGSPHFEPRNKAK